MLSYKKRYRCLSKKPINSRKLKKNLLNIKRQYKKSRKRVRYLISRMKKTLRPNGLDLSDKERLSLWNSLLWITAALFSLLKSQRRCENGKPPGTR
jgi:hypothetical protein